MPWALSWVTRIHHWIKHARILVFTKTTLSLNVFFLPAWPHPKLLSRAIKLQRFFPYKLVIIFVFLNKCYTMKIHQDQISLGHISYRNGRSYHLTRRLLPEWKSMPGARFSISVTERPSSWTQTNNNFTVTLKKSHKPA